MDIEDSMSPFDKTLHPERDVSEGRCPFASLELPGWLVSSNVLDPPRLMFVSSHLRFAKVLDPQMSIERHGDATM
jgi:hypothetical protein